MNVAIAGFLLWGVSLLLLFRVWRIGHREVHWTVGRSLLWALLILGAVVLLFRPHEDIFAGQDTGDYLNAGALFARTKTIFHVDPMLEQVSPENRHVFIRQGSYPSKYRCLRLSNAEQTIIGPWFQPAYPLLLGVAYRFLGWWAVFYVVPLFTIFAGLAVGAIAARLLKTHPWAGEAAFLIYLLTPLVIWHGRYSRPEVIASFFLLGGGTLLLDAGARGRWQAPFDLALGALAVTIAPFFHITSWMVILPVGLLVVMAVCRGRDDFLVFLVIGLLTFGVFVWQVFQITDTYSIRRFIRPFLDHWPWCLLGIVLVIGVLIFVSHIVRRRMGNALPRNGMEGSPVVGPARVLGLAFALAILAAYLLVYMVTWNVPPDLLKEFVGRYVYRTDLRCVLSMISLPMGALGLAGLLCLALMRDARYVERLVFLSAVVPASLLMGNMYDFFMTRYMLVVFAPLMAISIAALVTRIPVARGVGRKAFVVALLLICLLGLRNRMHLLTHTDYAGFSSYLESVAEEIKAQNGLLLCEYTNIAGPLDHFFGVSTLGLDNERKDDYTVAEKEWESIMRKNPARPAFFITPFARTPVSDRFAFEPQGNREYSGRRLHSRRWSLATEITEWSCGLRLYRMRLREKGAGSPVQMTSFPVRIDFSDGNMGLRRFTRPKEYRGVLAAGRAIGPETPLKFDIPPEAAICKGGQFWLIFLQRQGSSSPPSVRVDIAGCSTQTGWTELADGWWLCRTMPSGVQSAKATIDVAASGQTVLSAVRFVSGREVISVFDAWRDAAAERYKVPPFPVRRAHAQAEILAPLPALESYLCAFAAAPAEPGGEAAACFSVVGEAQTAERRIRAGEFQWEVWPLSAGRCACEIGRIVLNPGTMDQGVGRPKDDLILAMGHAFVLEGENVDPGKHVEHVGADY